MSKYEELKSYLPDVLTSIKDVDAHIQAVGAQMDDVDLETFRARDNNFIFLSDEKTVARLEKFMYIPYDQSRTLGDRKALIVSFFTGNGKIGAKEIKEVVNVFTPSPTEVAFADSTVNIKITRDISDTFILSDCYFILRKKLPAHLELVITIISSFQNELFFGSALTHYKEEVISICQPS